MEYGDVSIADAFDVVGASRAEGTSGGPVEGVWDGSSNGGQPLHAPGVDAGYRPEQALGVGVLRVVEDILDGTGLDGSAEVHDDDAVGHLRDDAQIVCDEDYGHSVFFLELSKEFEYLCLGGDVECGCGLVGDEELRLRGEGHGADRR